MTLEITPNAAVASAIAGTKTTLITTNNPVRRMLSLLGLRVTPAFVLRERKTRGKAFDRNSGARTFGLPPCRVRGTIWDAALQREQAPHDLVRTNIRRASRIVPLRAARAFLRDEQRTRRSRAAHLREKRRTAHPRVRPRGEGEGAQRVTPRELPEVARQPQIPELELRLQVHGTTEIEHPSQADLQVHSEQIVRVSVSGRGAGATEH